MENKKQAELCIEKLIFQYTVKKESYFVGTDRRHLDTSKLGVGVKFAGTLLVQNMLISKE